MLISSVAAYYSGNGDDYRRKLWTVALLHTLLIIITASSLISIVFLVSKCGESDQHNLNDNIHERVAYIILILYSNNSFNSNNKNNFINWKCVMLKDDR